MVMDSALLDRYVRNGDPEAFAELVRRYAGLVYSTCLRTTGNPQDAEDIAQECFLELARKAKRIDASLPGWLHRVARNRSIDLVRAEVRRKTREDKAAGELNGRAEPSWADILPYVDDGLASLPENLKAVILLHYFDGLSQKEVAERLGVSQATVSRDLNKSVSELRKRLEKLGIVVSAVLLASLITSNAASAAPQALIVSSTKIGLTGIGHSSGMSGIAQLMSKLTLPYMIMGTAASILIITTLTPPVVHWALTLHPGQPTRNGSIALTSGKPIAGPNNQQLIGGESAQLLFSGSPGGSCGATDSELRFELIGIGRIQLYQLPQSGRFRVYGTVRVVQTGQMCTNGWIDKDGKVISTEK